MKRKNSKKDEVDSNRTPKKQKTLRDRSEFSPIKKKLKFSSRKALDEEICKDESDIWKNYAEISDEIKNTDITIKVLLKIYVENGITNIDFLCSDELKSFENAKARYYIHSGSHIQTANILNRQKTSVGFDNITNALIMIDENSYHSFDFELLTPFSGAEKQDFDYTLSIVDKCVKRGVSLVSKAVFEAALFDLLSVRRVNRNLSSQSIFLWKLFQLIFSEVRPYTEKNNLFASPIEIFGLALILTIDNRLLLSPSQLDRVKNASMSLFYQDSTASVVSWKGWRLKYNDDFFKNIIFSFTSHSLRESLLELLKYLVLFDIPVSTSKKFMFKKYLLGVSRNKNFKVPEFSIVHSFNSKTNIFDDTELKLAAYDQKVSPIILLLVQCLMPFPPRNIEQHSCKALSLLINRLSSDINVRIMKKEMLGIETGELFRLQQYLNVKEDDSKEREASGDIQHREEKLKQTLFATSSLEPLVNKTKHEIVLFNVIKDAQLLLLHNKLDDLNFTSGTTRSITSAATHSLGRQPTLFERRTAFLLFFGRTLIVKYNKSSYSVLLSGDVERPFLIKSKQQIRNNLTKNSKFMSTGSSLYQEICNEAVKVFVSDCSHQKVLEPPLGFKWTFTKATVDVVILKLDETFRFFVDDVEISLFDAEKILEPCNVPLKIKSFTIHQAEVVKQLLYADNDLKNISTALQLFRQAYSLFSKSPISSTVVFDWLDIASSSSIPLIIWRDLLLKFSMRLNNEINFAINEDGVRKALHCQSVYEGTALRVMLVLVFLYANCLTMKSITSKCVIFKISTVQSCQYVHLMKSLKKLCFDIKRNIDIRGISTELHTVAITTKLWSHQQEAVNRVLNGIETGKKGFADASAVGSGKTLTALAVILEAQKMSSYSSGSLVLLPTKSLIDEWISQILLHTSGVHVIIQNAQGVLKSKGISNGGAKAIQANVSFSRTNDGVAARNNPALTPLSGPFSLICGNSVVITTLSRARDHEFKTTSWDFVVIDECLSVQSPALNAIHAWKNVLKSEFGVLMLSATFFRSKLKSLFYMIRMLRSELPKTESYLQTILHEHTILYIPKSPRSWTIKFNAVSLSSQDMKKYLSISGRKSLSIDMIFSKLQQFLKVAYEQKLLISEIQELLGSLGHKRVIVFARTAQEKARLLGSLKLVQDLKNYRKVKDVKKTLVLTILEGSQGLNLQDFNCIITRPQPGDVLEQMKGRIDRPGQKERQLEMHILLVKNTLEEVEAANIKLCGNFFRHYLNPLSKPYQNRAIEALLNNSKSNKEFKNQKKNKFNSTIACCYRKGLLDVKTESLPESVNTDTFQKKKTDEFTHQQNNVLGERKQVTVNRKAKLKKKLKVKKLHPEVFLSLDRKVLSHDILCEGLLHLGKDDRLQAVINQVGAPTSLLDRVGKQDPFKALARSIVYQQLSTKAAATIFNRFETLCGGEDLSVNPKRVLELEDERIKECGFSRRKVEYVKSLAVNFEEKQITRKYLESLTDSEVRDCLIKIKGLGDWSIHMFLMFSLGRVDVFPVGDLVVRKACKRLYNLNSGDSNHQTKVSGLPDAHTLHEIGYKWKPFRSIATWLLWHSVESEVCSFTY